MSVVKKLKVRFQSAHQDIIDGLRALTSTEGQIRNISTRLINLDAGADLLHRLRALTSTEGQIRNISTRLINLDAGADLLHRFQTNWSFIYSETSGSAQKAEEVAELLSPMLTIWGKYVESCTNLEQEARSLSDIFAMVTQLHTLLDSLRQDFLTAEKELDMLENICEEEAFQKRCLKEQKIHSVYKAKKESEVDKLKVNLAHLHVKKMADMESVKKVHLQDRTEAFMSAFQDDVKYYQTHGYPDRFPARKSLVSRLSRIELEQDSQALNAFLDVGGEPDEPGQLESSGEGAYFEDDYITDYSVKQDVDFLEESEYSSSSVIRELELEDAGSLYQTSHDCDDDDDDQKAASEVDTSSLPSSSELVDYHRETHDTMEETDGVERVVDELCDAPPGADKSGMSLTSAKNSEDVIE